MVLWVGASHSFNRRQVSPASTVIEFHELTSDEERRTTRGQVHPPGMDGADSDDEYDEAITMTEDDVASEDESTHQTSAVSVPGPSGSTNQATLSEQRTVTSCQTLHLRKARKGRSHDRTSARESSFKN